MGCPNTNTQDLITCLKTEKSHEEIVTAHSYFMVSICFLPIIIRFLRRGTKEVRQGWVLVDQLHVFR